MARLVGDDPEEERARWTEERVATLKREALRGIPPGRWVRMSETKQRWVERLLLALGRLVNRSKGE